MGNLNRVYIFLVIHTCVLSSSCLNKSTTVGLNHEAARTTNNKIAGTDNSTHVFEAQSPARSLSKMSTSSSSKYISYESKITQTPRHMYSSTTGVASLTSTGYQPSSSNTQTTTESRTFPSTTMANPSKAPTYITSNNYSIKHSKTITPPHLQSTISPTSISTKQATALPTGKSIHSSSYPPVLPTSVSQTSTDRTISTIMSSTVPIHSTVTTSVTHITPSIHPTKATSSQASTSTLSNKGTITKTFTETTYSVKSTKQESSMESVTSTQKLISYSSKTKPPLTTTSRTEGSITPTHVQKFVTTPGQTTIRSIVPSTPSSQSLTTSSIPNYNESTVTYTVPSKPSTKGYFTEITPTKADASKQPPEVTSSKTIHNSHLGLAKKDIKYVALGAAWGFVVILFIIITIVVRRKQSRKTEKVVLDDKDPETLAASFHMKNAENLVLDITSKPGKVPPFENPVFSDPVPANNSEQ